MTAFLHIAMVTKSNSIKITFFVILILYVVLAIAAHQYQYFSTDYAITRAVQSVHVAGFYSLMIFLSLLGNGWIPFILTGAASVALVLSRQRIAGLVCAMGVGLAAAFNSVIKDVVARPRPSLDMIHHIGMPRHLSFPSGHTIFYVTFFGFLIFLSYALIVRPRLRRFVIAVLSLMILLIGVSRIFEGAHWASDVAGGYLAGSLWLMLMIDSYRRLNARRAAEIAGRDELISARQGEVEDETPIL